MEISWGYEVLIAAAKPCYQYSLLPRDVDGYPGTVQYKLNLVTFVRILGFVFYIMPKST